LQLCRALNITTFATAGSADKCHAAEQFGAAKAINYATTPDWDQEVLEATSGAGVDLVLDLVCGSYFQKNMDVLNIGGRIAVIGSHGGHGARGCFLINALVLFEEAVY
jgi:NADPH:quinone reductase-like Zn-dependent oxidoreductase